MPNHLEMTGMTSNNAQAQLSSAARLNAAGLGAAAMPGPITVPRIIAAADAERRRLERNLHDGAQQRLVSLALTLRAVEA
jgi:signal transduction histidine kinase